MIYWDVVRNLTVALAILHLASLWTQRLSTARPWVSQLVKGLLLGALGVLGMVFSIPLLPGVRLDSRLSFIAASSLFGGWVSGLITTLIIGAYRLYLGGAGVVPGIVGIISTFFIGGFAHYWLKVKRKDPTPGFIFWIAVAVATWSYPVAFLIRRELWRPAILDHPTVLFWMYGPTTFLILLYELFSFHRAKQAIQLQHKTDVLEITQSMAEIGYFELSGNGVMTEFSDRACLVLGVDPKRKEIATLDDFFKHIHADDLAFLQSWYRKVEHGLKSDGVGFRVVWPGGGIRSVWGRLLLRKMDGYVGFIQDVTDQQSLREMVPELARLATLGEMSARTEHELKNPLTVLGSYLDILNEYYLEQKLPDERFALILSKMEWAVGTMTSVTRGVKFYSAGNHAAQSSVDVHQVIGQTVAIFQDLHPKADFELAVLKNASGFRINADAVHLQTILMNLLVNAAHAVADTSERRILLRTSNIADRMVIEVEDTGVGIPKENLARVFDPFFSTKEMRTGSGLGLNICRTLVENMNGTISVGSRPGEGTAFSVSVPVTTTLS